MGGAVERKPRRGAFEASAPEPSEDLAVALECEATPEDWVVCCLTEVARDGTLLAGSVDAHVELDQLGWPADESGSELPVER